MNNDETLKDKYSISDLFQNSLTTLETLNDIASGSPAQIQIQPQNCPICSNPNFKSISDVLNQEVKRVRKHKCQPSAAGETETENCMKDDSNCVIQEEDELNMMSYTAADVVCCPNCGQFHDTAIDEDGRNQECHCSECSPDKRLDLWTSTLCERDRIADRIMRCTGKRHCELLFNRCSTVDERDKQMVKRILEQVERQQHKRLKQLQNCERLDRKNDGIEISGLPAVVKEELIGENTCKRRSSWVTSSTLQQHLQEHKKDIKKVVAFFPDIENLQVIGKRMKIDVALEGCVGYEAEISVSDTTDASAVAFEVDGTSEANVVDQISRSDEFDRTSKTDELDQTSLRTDEWDRTSKTNNEADNTMTSKTEMTVNSESSRQTLAKTSSSKIVEQRFGVQDLYEGNKEVAIEDGAPSVNAAKEEIRVVVVQQLQPASNIKEYITSLQQELAEKEARLTNLYTEADPMIERVQNLQAAKDSRKEAPISKNILQPLLKLRPEQLKDTVDEADNTDKVDVMVLNSSRQSLDKTTSYEEQGMVVQDLNCKNYGSASHEETHLVVDVEYLHLAPDLTIELTNNVRQEVEEMLQQASAERALQLKRQYSPAYKSDRKDEDSEEERRETQLSSLSSAPDLIDLTKGHYKSSKQERPRESQPKEGKQKETHNQKNYSSPNGIEDAKSETQNQREPRARDRSSSPIPMNERSKIYKYEKESRKASPTRIVYKSTDSGEERVKNSQKGGETQHNSPSSQTKELAKRDHVKNKNDRMKKRADNLYLTTDLIRGIDSRSMNSMIFESYVVAPSDSSVGGMQDDSTERLMARTERRMLNDNNAERMLESIDLLSTLNSADSMLTNSQDNSRQMMGSTSAFAKLFLSRNGYWARGER